jgi:hypothetical protein
MYNELAIFNDAYFDNDDYDVDSANESIAGWLLANFAVFTTLLIKTIVRYSKQASKSHKTIVSVNDMVAHGMSRAEATKYAKKSIEWLRNRGYTYVDSSAPILTYRDLTAEGKQFVDGYFEYIGDMDTFSIRKAINANKSKLATLSRVADNVTAVLNTIIIVFYTAASPGGILLFPATLAVAYWAGTDLGESIVRIINQVRYSDKKPNAADAIESAYEDGYYQALADMGYDDIADEDVDIFDEDCFDDAMEGNLENKAKKKIWEYEQSGAKGIPEYNKSLYGEDGTSGAADDIRKFRERNYSTENDPKLRRRNRQFNGAGLHDRDSRYKRLAKAGGEKI